MKAAGVLIAVALALALQTTLAQLLVGGTAAIDLVLVAVVVGRADDGSGERNAGRQRRRTHSGFVVDRRAWYRRVGEVGHRVLAGAISQQFILTSALPRFLMFVGATVAHAALFMGLNVGLGLRTFPVAMEGSGESGSRECGRRHDCVRTDRSASGSDRASARRTTAAGIDEGQRSEGSRPSVGGPGESRARA